jgi:hypothetical protein
LQSNRKCISDGGDNPDRNAQFEYINNQAAKNLKRGNPVITGGYEEERTGREL